MLLFNILILGGNSSNVIEKQPMTRCLKLVPFCNVDPRVMEEVSKEDNPEPWIRKEDMSFRNKRLWETRKRILHGIVFTAR